MTQLKFFRILSMVEGISLLALLFIAMPIKYIGGNPLPVKYTGMAHGILFIAYVIFLFNIATDLKWSKKFAVLAFICSSIPFGMIYIDKKLKENAQ